MHHCEITECRATLLGFSYFAVTLDDGRVVTVCPSCMKKIKAERDPFSDVPFEDEENENDCKECGRASGHATYQSDNRLCHRCEVTA